MVEYNSQIPPANGMQIISNIILTKNKRVVIAPEEKKHFFSKQRHLKQENPAATLI
jgi:hypothetical protein